jgi:hypothetical protein
MDVTPLRSAVPTFRVRRVALHEMPSCNDVGIIVRQWGVEYRGISISEQGDRVPPAGGAERPASNQEGEGAG